MPKSSIISSNVFSTGTKFVVTEKTSDGSFGPGTTGVVSYVKGKDRDFPNVIYLKVAITKRGKTGKERLDFCEISTPIFEPDGVDMSGFMPFEKRRYYVHIEQAKDSVCNIMQMSNIDFMGWALSYAHYIFKLNSRAKRISVWPNENKSICNSMLNLCEYYNEDPEHAKEVLANTPTRVNFINEVRIKESTLVKCCLSYMLKVAQLEHAAIREISTRFPENAILADSVEAFSNKASALEAMSLFHGKGTAPLGKFAKDVSWS